MKKSLILLMLLGFVRISQAQQPTSSIPNTEVAVLVWDSQSFDFGKIKQGIPVTHEFKFTNKGKVTLVITNVQASCGCTTPSWSHDPVPPGQQGFVKATYNAGGTGAFDKTVTVTANTEPGATQLKIKGEVSTTVIP
jgi:hypothetical protein